MIVLPPGRFSTITGWPSGFCSSADKVLANVSLNAPGGNGTM
jgi:hypothetical protein